MGNNKSRPPKKELSEGKAIALTVLGIAIGIIAAGYLIRLIISFFFPGLF